MSDIFHWILVAGGVGFMAVCLIGFIRSLSLPPNAPEHRSHGKGDNWLT
jgi:hypothetical protein